MEQPLQIKAEVSGFEPFPPTLLTYLQYLCNSFKAGQVLLTLQLGGHLLVTVYYCLMFWEQV